MTATQRWKLIRELRKARLEFEAAQRRFSAPYSSHDALITFYERRGFYYGVGTALDVLSREKGTS